MLERSYKNKNKNKNKTNDVIFVAMMSLVFFGMSSSSSYIRTIQAFDLYVPAMTRIKVQSRTRTRTRTRTGTGTNEKSSSSTTRKTSFTMARTSVETIGGAGAINHDDEEEEEEKEVLCYLVVEDDEAYHQHEDLSSSSSSSSSLPVICTSEPEEYAWFNGLDSTTQLILTDGMWETALECVEGSSPRGIPEWECRKLMP